MPSNNLRNNELGIYTNIWDSTVRCAVAHYQFETLHPFQEVNGLMKTGEMGIIETKGKETEQDRVKKRFLQEWIDAVNQHGGFGKWAITKSKFSTRE